MLTWARHVDRVAEAVGDLVAGWVPIHEPALAARLGYGEGTFPPGRRKDDDQRDARAALLAAEAEAARLLRSGRAPVAVSPDTGDPHESDDLLVVSAPVDGLEGAVEGTAEASPHARLLVVTGDPEGSPAGAATGGDRTATGRATGWDRDPGAARPNGASAASSGPRRRWPRPTRTGSPSWAPSTSRRSTATSGTGASTPGWACSTGTATPDRPSTRCPARAGAPDAREACP